MPTAVKWSARVEAANPLDEDLLVENELLVSAELVRNEELGVSRKADLFSVEIEGSGSAVWGKMERLLKSAFRGKVDTPRIAKVRRRDALPRRACTKAGP